MARLLRAFFATRVGSCILASFKHEQLLGLVVLTKTK
jgi:hypothetical protein